MVLFFLGGKMAHYTFYHFMTLDSTTQYCLRNQHTLSNFTVISTEHQTNETCHDGNLFYDDRNALICSVFLKNEHFLSQEKMKEIFVLSIYHTIKEYGINLCFINPSFYLQSKKIGEIKQIIVQDIQILTILMNINTIHFLYPLKLKATSMKLILNQDFDIKKIKETIIFHFQRAYQKRKNQADHLQS